MLFFLFYTQGILVFVSYERYLRIKRPLDEPLKIRTWFVLIIVLSLGLVFPYTYTLGDKCISQSLLMRQIYVSLNVFRDVVAVTSMVNFNLKIAGQLKQKEDVYANVAKHVTNNRAKKVCNTLLRMVCVFIVLVIPVDLFQFAMFVLVKSWFKHMNTINVFLVLMQISNSIANVTIYSVTDQNFRRKFATNMRRAALKSTTLFGERQKQRPPPTPGSPYTVTERVSKQTSDDGRNSITSYNTKF